MVLRVVPRQIFRNVLFRNWWLLQFSQQPFFHRDFLVQKDYLYLQMETKNKNETKNV